MDIIKTGSTWILRTAPILDITGVRITGLTDIKFSVSRYTSGAWQWLDTADMTFRASPSGYQFTMTAVDATKVAGVYHYVIDWTTVTNVAFGDQLFFDVQQVTLTNASNPNQSSETAYGSIVDKVEANLTVATSTLATPTNITAGTITTVTNVTNAPTNGDLTPWADQGVLLLNRVLTVRPGAPASHRSKGWEEVTACAIGALVAPVDKPDKEFAAQTHAKVQAAAAKQVGSPAEILIAKMRAKVANGERLSSQQKHVLAACEKMLGIAEAA